MINHFLALLGRQSEVDTFPMLFPLLKCAHVGMIALVKKNSLALFLVASERTVVQELLADQDASAVFLRILKLTIISEAGSSFL